MVACLSIEHFRCFLESPLFTIFTDHKVLTTAFTSSSTIYTIREVCHLAYVAEFSTGMQYVSGLANISADALNRMAAVSLTGFKLENLAKLQRDDQRLQNFRSSSTSLHLEAIFSLIITSELPMILPQVGTDHLCLSFYAVKFSIPSVHLPTLRDQGIPETFVRALSGQE